MKVSALTLFFDPFMLTHTHTLSHSLSLTLTLTFYIISHHKTTCKECKGSSICEHGRMKVSALTLFFDPFMLTHTHTHSLLSLSLSFCLKILSRRSRRGRRS